MCLLSVRISRELLKLLHLSPLSFSEHDADIDAERELRKTIVNDR